MPPSLLDVYLTRAALRLYRDLPDTTDRATFLRLRRYLRAQAQSAARAGVMGGFDSLLTLRAFASARAVLLAKPPDAHDLAAVVATTAPRLLRLLPAPKSGAR